MFDIPILLIVFNRPETTKKVLWKLKNIKPKTLFIAADGPRIDNKDDILLCQQTRDLILQNIDWECSVSTLFQEKNLGCGYNPAKAITWFFEHNDEGIILEDDCIPSSTFFTFCKVLLEKYRYDDRIFVIGGNNFQKKEWGDASYFFSYYAHTWGWATWKRAWNKFDYKLQSIDSKILLQNLNNNFKSEIQKNHWFQLYLSMRNKPMNDIWDFQWTICQFYNNAINITPNKNLVSNIGFGEEATHTKMDLAGISNSKTFDLATIKHPKEIKIQRTADNYTFKNIFEKTHEKESLSNLIKHSLKLKLYDFGILDKFLPHSIPHIETLVFKKRYAKELINQKKRIAKIPRFYPEMFNCGNQKIKFVDSASFLFMYDEIFESEIYKFKSSSEKPNILDCGANIGMSVLYFKNQYPEAKIIAFEPDKDIFKVLKENVEINKLTNVTLIEKAVWNTETTLTFLRDGADGGRISEYDNEKHIDVIETVRLKDYIIDKKIDLLKIDIEGAELTVLEDCKNSLSNINRLFIEYHSFVNQQQEFSSILNILENAGFRYYVSHIGIESKRPFENINQTFSMDNQLNIFAYKK